MSVPSKLVEQRPDVREYSALLHEATAQVGVATANMLPQLTLTGSYGGDAVKFADLFSPSSAVWSIAGSVTQPLFKGGQLLHQRRARPWPRLRKPRRTTRPRCSRRFRTSLTPCSP